MCSASEIVTVTTEAELLHLTLFGWYAHKHSHGAEVCHREMERRDVEQIRIMHII